jgi:hypothetical protein
MFRLLDERVIVGLHNWDEFVGMHVDQQLGYVSFEKCGSVNPGFAGEVSLVE